VAVSTHERPAAPALLCGDCWAITAEDRWDGLAYADDGSLTEAFDDPSILRCPVCSYLHLDTDDDPGVWGGSQLELARIRTLERSAA
jgi:hypothetical protein